jgi:hypothetical protein
MSGFVVQRTGFVLVPDLISSIITDLTANGFTLEYPTTAIVKPAPNAFKATLEATATVDPLADTQKWRIHFDVIDQFQAKMYVAAATQLPDDGSTSKLELITGTQQESAGVIGSDLKYPYKLDATTLIVPTSNYMTGDTPTAASVAKEKRINNADSQFIDRSIRIPDVTTAQSYPMSYYLSITPRGFVLTVWEEAQDSTGQRFSWVCVQRPVDRNTGAVLADPATKCPLFCVYGLKDMYIPAAIYTPQSDGAARQQVMFPERWESGVKKFVVREIDIEKPTLPVPATYDSPDSNGIINGSEQVAITEDDKYVILFPNRLNTPRYAYAHELDLISYTSADVISQWSDVPLTVYGEAQPRKYKAMLANGGNNTKMRYLQLTSGGGIS